MDTDLHQVYLQVTQVDLPEDLFGSEDVILPEDTLLRIISAKYQKLKAVTKPELYHDPLDVEAATEVDQALERLYAMAESRIRRHVYGIEGRGKLRPPYAVKSFAVGPHRYYIGRKLADGDHTVLFEGFMEREGAAVGEVVIKIARETDHNSFVKNEVRNLDILHDVPVPQWRHLPLVLDRFQSGGRMGLVFRKMSGFSLTEVRRHRAHLAGVDRKHMIWMLDRSLSCLGFVHSQGIVHGNLRPDHMMIQPLNHNLIVVGWSSGVAKPAITGEKVLAEPDDYTAPEVKDRGRIGPWSDIYSLGKVMIWLLGGDARTNEIPNGVEEPVRLLLLKLVAEDTSVRPSDAWDLHAQQCQIKDSLWPRKFLYFDMT